MDRGEPFSGKRKIDDEIEIAKQKAQAIAARFLIDADSKRPRIVDDSSPTSFEPSFPLPYTAPTNQYNGVPSSKKIAIPNSKVGVIIGRAGDMIKNIQQRSGARIQITRDSEADPTSMTRDVELVGTQEQITRAEDLITEVIAETDAPNSGSGGNRNAAPLQPGSEQFVMKVPNEKVALVIGKGGETIKTMQSTTGARIQVVPLHLPPGDTSTERNVFISGTQEQIESAKELVNEVISGNRLKMASTNPYTQSAYPPATSWPPQGQPPAQQAPAYGYTQPGSYPMQTPSYYGGYPPQPTGWEQQNAAAPTSQQQSTAYNAYGQQAPHNVIVNYNYSQMPPATGYNYSQGYTDQTNSYANPSYGSSATSTQPDGSVATQTSQPGYGTPAQSGQPDGTAQTQPPSAYATGYNQPAAAAPANGYGAYPSYSGAPPAQPAYSQTGYPQMGYGQQQDGQVPNQASYPYYGQQPDYYQGAYPSVPPPQVAPQTQPANGVSQTDGGDATTGSGAVPAAKESETPQS